MAKHFLKDLVITKVDFVDAGCNQRANIMITKRDNEKGGENVNKENNAINMLAEAIAKAFGTDLSKGAGFNEVLESMSACRKIGKIREEIWDLNEALFSSLNSILEEETAEKAAFMKQSIDEFSSTVKSCIDKWAVGERAGVTKKADGTLAIESLEKSDEVEQEPLEEVEKKEEASMGLTVEEQNMLDLLMKKANIAKTDEAPVADPEPVDEVVEEPEVKEEVIEEPAVEEVAEVEKSVDEVIKGINPAIADILKNLDEQQEKARDAKFAEVAKKYEILGIKSDDMAEVLKSVHGTAQYDAVVKRFDDMLEQVNNSGLFTEIGKSGSGSVNNAWSCIEKHADEIQAKDPSVSREKAIDKACELHPELVQEYERGL